MSPTISNTFVTITCDGPNCVKTITFPQTTEGEQEAVQANPWLTSVRFVQTPDQRKFIYCGDECEIKAAGAGSHNKKVLVAPQGPNSVDLAAQAAARAAQATQALKAGGPVTLG
jgi:hypothetical protein